MLLKRFKEWITTLLGLALAAAAGYMLFIGKITAAEFTAFLPICIGLIWAKNSFLTDIFKRGSGGAALVLIAIVTMTGCRTPKIPAPVLPSIISNSSTNNVSSGGTAQAGYTKPDSASIKALMACDSLGNVYIRTIADLQMGHNVKPSIQVKDNYIYLKCNVDSLAVYEKWLRFYNSTSDTVTQVQYLPGTVTNELKWYQKLLIKLGWLFCGSVLLGIAYIVYKLKF